MIEQMIADPDGWQMVAVMVCSLVAIGLAFLCISWGMWSD